ncbi:unnamed protein product [Chrysoparadoxa australica]
MKPSNFITKEDPRLREQDFGNFQDPSEMKNVFMERAKYGRFWFRFPNGESGADVFDRAGSFFDSLFRAMEQEVYTNCIVITHGLMMRLFLMRYLGWSVANFEATENPDNAEVWVMEKQCDGSYALARFVLWP